MTYEVSLVIVGAHETFETHRNEGAAYAAADRLAQEAEAVGVEAEVYVTPHYCRPADDECVCVSWLPDHKPYRAIAA